MKATEAILVKEKKKLNRTIIMLSILAIIVSGGMFVVNPIPGIDTYFDGCCFVIISIVDDAQIDIQMGVAPISIHTGLLDVALNVIKVMGCLFRRDTMLLIGLLILNCALWLFAGRMLKLQYFTISGAAGLLLIIGICYLFRSEFFYSFNNSCENDRQFVIIEIVSVHNKGDEDVEFRFDGRTTDD